MNKALVMLGGEHHPFDSCGKILSDFLTRTGVCEPKLTTDRDAFKHLKKYDVVIVYTQGGELTPEQEQGLCEFVKNGGGFIGIHCASDSFVKNDSYMELIGGHFIRHGPVTEFAVAISEPDHEVMRRAQDFRITDEFYILEKKTPKFDVLAMGTWHFETHPMVYIRDYGKGRVFYTALGHDERAFNNPGFQKFLYRGVRWTTKQREGKPVRCGIVGYGEAFNMGRHHADIIREVPGLEVRAVCDMDRKRLEIAKEEQPGVALYSEVKKMVEADVIDLGVVVTPHNTHASVALALIEGGKHVICEKPFSITVQEATDMIEAAKAKGVLLSTFHNRRWDSDFMTIRQIIHDGLIGEVFHIEAYSGSYGHPRYWWRSHKAISGGAIYDWGAHFVDWILNLMPGKMESVYGFFHKRVWHDVTNEDQCHAIIRFEGGRCAEFQTSQIAAVGKPKWRILGTKGGLIATGNNPIQVTTFVNRRQEELQVPLLERSWDAYYHNIADHLLAGEALAVTPESARRVIAVLELAEKASESGQPQPVPYE